MEYCDYTLLRMLGIPFDSEEAQEFIRKTDYLTEKYDQLIEEKNFVCGLSNKILRKYKNWHFKKHEESYFETMMIVNQGEDREMLELLVQNCYDHNLHIPEGFNSDFEFNSNLLCHVHKLTDKIKIPCQYAYKEGSLIYCKKR
jgi:hypothetical protein